MGLEKAAEQEIKLPTFNESWKKQRISRKTNKQTNLFFIDYIKAFDCVDYNKLWKILEEMGVADHINCLLRNLYQVKKQQLELDTEQLTGSKLGKEYVKAVYCHPPNFTYTQSTACEMLGWMNHSWNQGCWEKYQQPQICRR